MKQKMVLSLIALPLLLLSCSKNKNAIYVLENADLLSADTNRFIESKEDKILSMLKSQESFILYEYSTGCSHCEEVSKNFEKYLNKYPYCIYRFNVYLSSDYHLLNEYDSVSFPETIITPRVLIINNGKVVDEVNTTKLSKAQLFNSALNAFIKKKEHMYSVSLLSSYQLLGEKLNDFETCVYNSKDNNEFYLECYNNNNLDKDYVFINEMYAEEALLNYVNK